MTLKDLYLGGVITVYSRQLTIERYADKATADYFAKATAATVAVAKLSESGKIIDHLHTQGFILTELRLTAEGLALKLMGDDAVSRLQAIAASVGAQLGVGALTAAADAADAEARAAGLFGGLPAVGGAAEASALIVVKPHAVAEGLLGRILDQTMACGFTVSNATMVQLNRPNSQEFLEVYKGVVPEYSDWAEELVGGKCVALQVSFTADPSLSVLKLRELCGAHDPEIAGHLHKGSLRASFGRDKVRNAVHCTDLQEDGPLEVDYFFRIMQ